MYLWQEPDALELPGRILKDIPALKVIRAPPDFKDLNEAHIKGEDVPALLERLKAAAIPAETLRKLSGPQGYRIWKRLRKRFYRPRTLWIWCIELLFRKDTAAMLDNHDCLCGRHVPAPEDEDWSYASPSATCSSGQCGKIVPPSDRHPTLPDEAYHVIDAGSPRVLIYDDADLQHRVLIFCEADSLPAREDNPAASAVRNLLQEHCLKYKVTVKNPEIGEYSVKEVEKPGPTVMISTST